MKIFELLPELFTESELMILDFNQIPSDLPDYKNIKSFFDRSKKLGIDPKQPKNRQMFNDNFLARSKKRYLISQYMEDRIEMLRGSKIAEEGRTFHLGIDIFSKDLDPIYAPCDGEIIVADKEGGNHSFGHYLIIKPDIAITNNYIFLGHLSKDLPKLGPVSGGQLIARLGDYTDNENGGWSRHVHVQLFKNIPEDRSFLPGYSTEADLKINSSKYPDPSFIVFPEK